MTDNNRPRAVGYIRVSTQGQAENGVSLDMQRARIEAYCNFYEIDLVQIIEDAGKSGKNLKRDGVQELIALIKSKEIDAVVIYKLDRLGRSVTDLISLTDLMGKSGVDFHSITEKLDTTTAFGRFFFVVIAALAQLERDIISERTKDALNRKREKGERVGFYAPIGKMLVDGKLVDNPREIKAIILARQYREKGLSLRKIAARLAQDGFNAKSGRPYSSQTVSALVERELDGDYEYLL